MINWLKSLFQDSTPSGMEELVSLIRVAQEDKNVKTRLLDLLEQPEQVRLAEISRWVQHSRENGAPEDFVTALTLLKDSQIAKVTLAQLLVKDR